MSEGIQPNDIFDQSRFEDSMDVIENGYRALQNWYVLPKTIEDRAVALANLAFVQGIELGKKVAELPTGLQPNEEIGLTISKMYMAAVNAALSLYNLPEFGFDEEMIRKKGRVGDAGQLQAARQDIEQTLMVLKDHEKES